MSFGQKSELFVPVTPEIAFTLGSSYPRTNEHLNDLYSILTDHCKVETLLFTALLDMLDRALSGSYDYYERTAAMVMLSVLPKSGQDKYTTHNLGLLHDVVVEIHMAGRNFRNLQKYLESHGLVYVSLHSCGGGISPISREDHFYELTKMEQLKRTELDWVGSSVSASIPTILQNGIDAEKILETCNRITRNASLAISANTLRVSGE